MGSNPTRPANSKTRVLEKNSQKLENPFTRKYYPDSRKDVMDGKIAVRPALSITNIQVETEQDPLKSFYNGIKSKETKEAYTKTVREFLFSIVELQGTFEKKAIQFVEYARKNQSETKQLLKNYATYLKQRTEKPRTIPEYLNPNTVPNKFKGIKKFLKMNEIPM